MSLSGLGANNWTERLVPISGGVEAATEIARFDSPRVAGGAKASFGHLGQSNEEKARRAREEPKNLTRGLWK